jgi:ATP-dependent protease ClpP protease subunit
MIDDEIKKDTFLVKSKNNHHNEENENEIITILDSSMIIRNCVDGIYKIYIYDIIAHDMYKSKQIVDLLGTLTKDDKVEIYIESHGGSVRSGLMLCAAIQSCKAHVTTCVMGFALSMGFVIWCFGDELKLFPGAYVMAHNILLYAYGSLGKIQDDVDFNKGIITNIFNLCVKKKVLLEEEVDDIINRKKDIFIPYDIMLKRISQIGE